MTASPRVSKGTRRALLAGCLILVALIVSGCSNGRYVLRPNFFWDSLFKPSPAIINGLGLTLGISVLAQIIGVILGVFAAMGKMAKLPILRVIANIYIWIFRGTPLLVQLAFFYYGLAAAGIFKWPALNAGPVDILPQVLAGIVILTVALCYKEFLLLSFDPVVAEAMGYPVQALNSLLLTLVALTIVISIQAVGIVLVVALLVTPSATAYLVTERFFRMMLLGILFSILAIVSGLYLSFYLNVASGATIVLVSTCIFFLTLGVRRLTHPAAPSI